MRILQINNCHHRRGGADVVYLNTGELLEKKGHDVFYFSQHDDKNYGCKTEEYFIDNIDYFKKSIVQKIMAVPRFFYSIEAKHKIERLITELKPDIAHIHTYKGTLSPSILQILKTKGFLLLFLCMIMDFYVLTILLSMEMALFVQNVTIVAMPYIV